MAAIAGLMDFRQEGPPADIGTFQLPCRVLVFQHTFAGTTYVCAVRAGVRGWVLVDYGTVASTVIQAAINVLPAIGGEIFIMAAVYTLLTTILVNKHGVSIFGENPYPLAGTCLRLANGANVDMIEVTGIKCHISNLNLDGNKANQAVTTLQGIYAHGGTSQDLHIDHCYIFNVNGIGIFSTGDGDNYHAVYSEGHYDYGWKLTGNYGVLVGCYSCFNGKGIWIDGSQNMLIGCTILQCSYGILMGYDNAIHDNIVSSCQLKFISNHGIWMNKATRIVIDNNIFFECGKGTNNTYDCVYMASLDGVPCTHNIISANSMSSDLANLPRYGINESDANQDYNTIIGNDIQNVATRGINWNGVNSKVKDNQGFVTENSVLSPTFAIDATGIKTVTIPHGLAITPAKKDCALTVVEETDVDDWRYDFLKVDTVDATNVIAKINVSTASVTAGATARLALRVGAP